MGETATWRRVETPPGPFEMLATTTALVCAGFNGVSRRDRAWLEERPRPRPDDGSNGLLDEAERQLREYFAGTRREFDLPYRLEGPAFHRRVWQALLEIPFGATLGYGELARRLGRGAGAARAVGQACHRNPVGLFVPCHRVVGAGGALTGYGGGIDVKRRLLEHERGTPGLPW